MNELKSWAIGLAMVIGWIGIVVMLIATPSCSDGDLDKIEALVKAHRDATGNR